MNFILNKKNLLKIFLITILLHGCASAPKVVKQIPDSKERIITIKGSHYVSLIDIIENYDLDYEYDTFLRSVMLGNDEHVLKLIIDRDIALIDNRPMKLSSAPIMDQGEPLIPLELKQKTIDTWLIKPSVSIARIPAFKIRKIVIDAGHGGKDPGAVGRGGLYEKDVNLDIARKLRDQLQAQGIEVVMTRDTDVFIPLSTRAAIANDSGADFFLSVHTNAHRDRSIRGVEVYYLSNQVDDFLRAKSSRYDSLPRNISAEVYGNSADINTIIWDVIFTGNRKQSIILAKDIDKDFPLDINSFSRGIKAAQFYVLKHTKIPAVLVEVGFISNSGEEGRLKSSSYRTSIASALARKIISHNRQFSRR